MVTTRYDLSRSELAELLEGEPPYRIDQVWEGLHAQHREPSDLTNVPKALRSAIDELLPPALSLAPFLLSTEYGGVLSPRCSALNVECPVALSTQYSVLSTQYSVLSAQYVRHMVPAWARMGLHGPVLVWAQMVPHRSIRTHMVPQGSV